MVRRRYVNMSAMKHGWILAVALVTLHKAVVAFAASDHDPTASLGCAACPGFDDTAPYHLLHVSDAGSSQAACSALLQVQSSSLSCSSSAAGGWELHVELIHEGRQQEQQEQQGAAAAKQQAQACYQGVHMLCNLHLQASGDGAISVQTLACQEPGARPELAAADAAGAEQASQALAAAVVQEAISRVRQACPGLAPPAGDSVMQQRRLQASNASAASSADNSTAGPPPPATQAAAGAAPGVSPAAPPPPIPMRVPPATATQQPPAAAAGTAPGVSPAAAPPPIPLQVPPPVATPQPPAAEAAPGVSPAAPPPPIPLRAPPPAAGPRPPIVPAAAPRPLPPTPSAPAGQPPPAPPPPPPPPPLRVPPPLRAAPAAQPPTASSPSSTGARSATNSSSAAIDDITSPAPAPNNDTTSMDADAPTSNITDLPYSFCAANSDACCSKAGPACTDDVTCSASKACVPAFDDCHHHDGDVAACAAKPYCSLLNGTCVLADPGKHSCAAAKEGSTCAAVRGPQGQPLCSFVATCSSACSACQACLHTVTASFLAVTPPAASAYQVAAAFAVWCSTAGYQPAACLTVQRTILESTDGNFGRRAGALCSLLGPCSGQAAAKCTFRSFALDLEAGLQGYLDQCTVEGVSGGSQLPEELPEAAVTAATAPAGTCFQDSECPGQGTLCNRADHSVLVCGCSGGVDSCTAAGRCSSYCNVSSVQRRLAEHNSLVCVPMDINSCRHLGEYMCWSDPLRCHRYSCNATSGEISAKPCIGVCRPEYRYMRSAAFTDSKTGINVTLHSPALPGTYDCRSVFDYETTLRLGSGAVCTVTADSNTTGTLMVALGSGASIMLNGDLTLHRETALVAISNSSNRFAGTVNVSLCAKCQPPQPVIVGPTVVPQLCGSMSHLFFDARGSRDSSGRALRSAHWSLVDWRAIPDNETVKHLYTGMFYANKEPAVREQLLYSIKDEYAANVTPGTYTLQLRVTDFLGIAATLNHTVTFTSSGNTAAAPAPGTPIVVDPAAPAGSTAGAGTTDSTSTAGSTVSVADAAPMVVLPGGPKQGFNPAQGLKLQAVLLPGSLCPGREVDFTWASNVPGMPSKPYTGKDLLLPGPLPPAPPAPAARYWAEVTARFKGSTASSSARVALTAVLSPLVAQLHGTAGDVSVGRDIVLSAAASFDPDDALGRAPLTFSWECIREDYPWPCFLNQSRGNRAGASWTLPASLLAHGRDLQHTFRVTVSKGSRAASAQVTVTPRLTPVPSGRLVRVCGPAGCPARHNHQLPLTVQFIADSADSTITNWRVIPRLAERITTTSPSLTCPAADLPKTGQLLVTAYLHSTTNSTLNGITQLSVPIDQPPACNAPEGTCVKIFTLNRWSLTSRHLVAAYAFSDDGQQLQYEMGSVDPATGRRRPVAFGQATSAEVTGLAAGQVELYACARDESGSELCHQQAVTVWQPDQFSAVTALSDFSIDGVATATPEALAASSQLLASLLAAAGSSQDVGSSSRRSGAGGSEATYTAAAADLAALPLAEQEAVGAQASELVWRLVNGLSLLDAESAQPALASLATLAAAAGGALNDTARGQLLLVAQQSLQASLAQRSGINSQQAAQVLQLLAAALDIRAAAASATTSRRRSLLSAITSLLPLPLAMHAPGATAPVPGPPGRHLLALAADPAAAMAAQARLQSATFLMDQVIQGIASTLNPTQVRSTHASGLSAAVRSELRASMAGAVLEAGPDATNDQQTGSAANIKVALPAGLELPAAACVPDGLACIEPPALLRVEGYSSWVLFDDVLTNGYLDTSTGSTGYSDIVPVSVVINVTVPTHVGPSATLQCAANTAGSAATPCGMWLQLPLVTAPSRRHSFACVQLLAVGGLASSVQQAHTATISSAGGFLYATCHVPSFGTYLVIQYVDPAAPEGAAFISPQLGRTDAPGNATTGNATSNATVGGVAQDADAAAGEGRPMQSAGVAGVILGCVVTGGLMVGAMVMAYKNGLLCARPLRASQYSPSSSTAGGDDGYSTGAEEHLPGAPSERRLGTGRMHSPPPRSEGDLSVERSGSGFTSRTGSPAVSPREASFLGPSARPVLARPPLAVLAEALLARQQPPVLPDDMPVGQPALQKASVGLANVEEYGAVRQTGSSCEITAAEAEESEEKVGCYEAGGYAADGAGLGMRRPSSCSHLRASAQLDDLDVDLSAGTSRAGSGASLS